MKFVRNGITITVGEDDDTDYSKAVSTTKVGNADKTGYTEYGMNVVGNPVSKKEVSIYGNARRNPSTFGAPIQGVSNPSGNGLSGNTITIDPQKDNAIQMAERIKRAVDGKMTPEEWLQSQRNPVITDEDTPKDNGLFDLLYSDDETPGDIYGGYVPPTAQMSEFKPSQTYLQAMQYTQSLLDKLSSGRTSYSDKLDDIMAQINGREKFSYDFNSDPMFLSALQSSMNSGRLAMQDTMGQASALTGGYGSSYGQAVGNQAYNAEVQRAYDNLPEFYGMALDAYNNETQGLLNQLDMYGTADANEYERLANAYASNAQAAAQLYDQEYNNFWQTQDFNENARRWDAEMAYQQKRDNAADELAYAKLLTSNATDAQKAAELKTPSASILADGIKAYNKGVEAYSDFTDEMEAQGYNVALIDSHVEQNGQLPLSDLTFTKVKDTANGFGGVDRNDVVEASNGQQYKLSELRKLLEEQGMSKEKAKEFVLKLTDLEEGQTYSKY